MILEFDADGKGLGECPRPSTFKIIDAFPGHGSIVVADVRFGETGKTIELNVWNGETYIPISILPSSPDSENLIIRAGKTEIKNPS